VPAGAWTATHLDVADVRSWHRVSVDLPPGGIVLCGPNGAGKTSLVEALVLACLGVSCRTSRESEAVRMGSPALHVSLDLHGPSGAQHREIGYASGRGRRLTRDGDTVRSLADWRAAGSVLVFLPEELRAVKGPPAARRRHLDRLLEAAAPGYADDLAAYGASVSQRNAALRGARAGRMGVDAVAPWEPAMAAHGARIIAARRDALHALSGPFARWMEDLGGGPGAVVRLEPSPAALADVPTDALEGHLVGRLRDARPREIAAGLTLAGPHRDDVFVGQERDGTTVDLRAVGSQGEQRTAVLALIMAHREYLGAHAGLPILVLDDVLSELDPRRRGLLLDALVGAGQCLLTTADPAAADAAAQRGAHVVTVERGVGVTTTPA